MEATNLLKISEARIFSYNWSYNAVDVGEHDEKRKKNHSRLFL